MTPEDLQAADRYWAAELGTTPEFLAAATGINCLPQSLYAGVQMLRRGRQLFIACPTSYVAEIAERTSGHSIEQVFSPDYLETLLSPGVEKIIGPAEVHYADRKDFRPSYRCFCRLLTPADATLYQTFADSLSSVELEQSGFDPHEAPAFGAFVDGTLCAAASFQMWPPRIAHITVATHPAHRRRGYARAAISALAEHAFSQNLILQYRALTANSSSIQLATSLGFQHHCSTLFARLSVDSNRAHA